MNTLRVILSKIAGAFKLWEIFALCSLASIFYGIHMISRPWAFITAGLVGCALYCLHEISILFAKRARR